ncbi:MAG: SIS domain-containing protein, partial [Rickettsiales bacterium]|nr:SIS domain-containing protein [Rickettsiales bacterium]
NNLMIFVSQSGETADTLAALKYAKTNKQKILSIVNAPFSSMANLSDVVIRTVAGPEIGVASTKAYTAQLAILSLLAIDLADKREAITKEEKDSYLQDIITSSGKIEAILEKNNIENIKLIAKSLKKAKHLLYIGRGISQISAFESALKFRELTYIDAQGIAAGELKHGTIALIDKKMPVIVIAPTNKLFEKTLSNAEEVKARNGKIIFISDKKGLNQAKKLFKKKIEIPQTNSIIDEALVPIISTQLLAYYCAHFKKNDVDQPRNLAKSVTVE